MSRFTKFIFLDIDGVLVTHRSIKLLPRVEGFGMCVNAFDPYCVAALNTLAAENVAIVVTSCWRIGVHVADLRGMMQRQGVTVNILGAKTGRLPGKTRGDEIQQWLDTHKDVLDIESFVILDDDSDFGPLLLTRHVKTSLAQGLTAELAAIAEQILGTNL